MEGEGERQNKAVFSYELWTTSGESRQDIVQSCPFTHVGHNRTLSVFPPIPSGLPTTMQETDKPLLLVACGSQVKETKKVGETLVSYKANEHEQIHLRLTLDGGAMY